MIEDMKHKLRLYVNGQHLILHVQLQLSSPQLGCPSLKTDCCQRQRMMSALCDVNETTPTSKSKVQPLLENSFDWVVGKLE